MGSLDDVGARHSRHAAPEQKPDYGRAGRNIPASIAVGLSLLAIVLLPLFFLKDFWWVVPTAAACLGSWEMARAMRAGGASAPIVPVVSGAVAIIALAWYTGIEGLSVGLLIAVLAALVWRMGEGPVGYQRDMGAAALILVYVPFLLGFAALLAKPDDGAWRILVTLLAVVLSDTGGYVAGVIFGKHPMAPAISPKKSWEGFTGSILAAAVGSAILGAIMLDLAPWKGAIFGVVVSAAAVLGDLAESLIKRDLGVKDMSGLLPGHGGLMDRLDSILFAVPTAYLLLSVLAV